MRSSTPAAARSAAKSGSTSAGLPEPRARGIGPAFLRDARPSPRHSATAPRSVCDSEPRFGPRLRTRSGRRFVRRCECLLGLAGSLEGNSSRRGRGSDCRLRRYRLRDAAGHSLGSETVGDSVSRPRQKLTGIRRPGMTIVRVRSRAFLNNRHRRLPGASGRTWRMSAPQISAKPTRGATNATSIAVVKIGLPLLHA